MASEGGDSKNIDPASTVEPSKDRFVFLCYKSPESWPSRVEDFEADLFPMLLLKAIETRKADMKVKTHLNIFERPDGGTVSDGDVLIFPDNSIFSGIEESGVDSFVENVLLKGNPPPAGSKDVLTGSYVFVCAHENVEKRSGVSVPNLIQKFKKEIESKGLKDNVQVTACFDIGEREYEYNVTICNANTEGKIDSYRYRHVTPEIVTELLDQHFRKGETSKNIWRAQKGASVEEGNRIQNQKLEVVKELNNEETISSCSPAICQTGASEEKIEETISSCSPAICQTGASEEEIEETISGSPAMDTIAVYTGPPQSSQPPQCPQPPQRPQPPQGSDGGNPASIPVGAIAAIVAALIYGFYRMLNRKRA